MNWRKLYNTIKVLSLMIIFSLYYCSGWTSDSRSINSYQFEFNGEIHQSPSNRNQAKFRILQNSQITPLNEVIELDNFKATGNYISWFPAHVYETDPDDTQQINFGYSYPEISYELTYKGNKYLGKGPDLRYKYTHKRSLNLAPTIDYDKHITIKVLNLFIDVNDSQIIPICNTKFTINHKFLETFKENDKESLFYDGHTAYISSTQYQKWLDHSNQEYQYASTKRIREIDTHIGNKVIYTEPYKSKTTPQHQNLSNVTINYSGEYKFVKSVIKGSNEQHPTIKENLLIYSDGKSIFIPYTTQEIWYKSERNVNFFIASYHQDSKIRLNNSFVELDNSTFFPTGLYQRILSFEEDLKIEKWLKIESPIKENFTIYTLKTPKNKTAFKASLVINDEVSSERKLKIFSRSSLVNSLKIYNNGLNSISYATWCQYLKQCFENWEVLDHVKISSVDENNLNKIAELLRNLKMFSYIKTLDFKEVFFKENEFSILNNSLSTFSKLEALKLGINNINGKEVPEFANKLSKLTNLIFLDLENTGFGNIGPNYDVRYYRSQGKNYFYSKESLPAYFISSYGSPSYTGYRYIGYMRSSLPNDVIGVDSPIAEGSQKLSKSLKSLINLKRLNLRGNGFNDSTSFQNLVDALKVMTNLEELHLGFSPYRIRMSNQEAQSLQNSLILLTNLQKLDFPGCEIEKNSKISLIFSLSKLKSLTELTFDQGFYGNVLRLEECQAFAHSLAFFTSLQKLEFKGLPAIDGRYFPLLGESISKCTMLEELNFDSCLIGYKFSDEDNIPFKPFDKLHIYLYPLNNLQIFNFQANAVGDNEINNIIKALVNLKNLKMLKFKDNRLSNDTYIQLLTSLEHLSQLEEVSLGYLSNTIQTRLDAIQKNQLTHLKKLKIIYT